MAVLFGAVMRIAGVVLAGIIASALLGAAVSALFAVEIKRSCLVAVLFMLVHIGIGFSLMLG